MLHFSRPGKPVDNAFIESFNGRLRDECLNTHWFYGLEQAREVIAVGLKKGAGPSGRRGRAAHAERRRGAGAEAPEDGAAGAVGAAGAGRRHEAAGGGLVVVAAGGGDVDQDESAHAGHHPEPPLLVDRLGLLLAAVVARGRRGRRRGGGLALDRAGRGAGLGGRAATVAGALALGAHLADVDPVDAV